MGKQFAKLSKKWWFGPLLGFSGICLLGLVTALILTLT